MKKFQNHSFPLKLKMLRIEAGKSQEEFSRALGVSRSCLANYETGKRQPNGEMLLKIAELCNIAPRYLIDRPAYEEAALREQHDAASKRAMERIRAQSTTLDISNLTAEERISLIAYYDYVLQQQQQSAHESIYRIR